MHRMNASDAATATSAPLDGSQPDYQSFDVADVVVIRFHGYGVR